MNALTIFIIMKLNTISSALFWGAVLYCAYLVWEYARIWWNTSVEDTSIWTTFWMCKRKRATLAALLLLVSMIIPSTRDAIIMTAVPAIARHSIWDRLLGGTAPNDTVEHAKRLLQNSDR